MFSARELLRRFFAAFLLALTGMSAYAASDCVLDDCSDRQASPQTREYRYNPRRGGAAPAGDFDFYVLALSWSPSFCAGGGAERSRNQCAPGANPGFVVHGLWPQYFSGAILSNCGGNRLPAFFGAERPERALSRPGIGAARMAPAWSLCPGKIRGLFRRRARGARSGDDSADPPGAGRRSASTSPLDVQRAFIEANPRLRPGMMAVTCRRGVLQEARICFSKDLRDFVACPQVARAGCRSQSIDVPAGR